MAPGGAGAVAGLLLASLIAVRANEVEDLLNFTAAEANRIAVGTRVWTSRSASFVQVPSMLADAVYWPDYEVDQLGSCDSAGHLEYVAQWSGTLFVWADTKGGRDGNISRDNWVSLGFGLQADLPSGSLDFEIFAAHVHCGKTVTAPLTMEFVGGVAFKAAFKDEYSAGSTDGGADGSFALSGNGSFDKELPNKTALLDVGVPVWEDMSYIFTQVPRALIGSTLWPGIKSKAPGEGELYFETDVGGMLFVFTNASAGANIPPYLTESGTRWTQLADGARVTDAAHGGEMAQLNLTVWSRPVSPGYRQVLMAAPGFGAFMVAFKPNTETEYVHTEQDSTASGDPASPRPGDAVYFPTYNSTGSCGGRFSMKAMGPGTVFAWSAPAPSNASVLLDNGWIAVSTRAVPAASGDVVYAMPTPGNSEDISLPDSAGFASANFAYVQAFSFVNPPFALTSNLAPYPQGPQVLATGMRAWADRTHVFDALPAGLGGAAYWPEIGSSVPGNASVGFTTQVDGTLLVMSGGGTPTFDTPSDWVFVGDLLGVAGPRSSIGLTCWARTVPEDATVPVLVPGKDSTWLVVVFVEWSGTQGDLIPFLVEAARTTTTTTSATSTTASSTSSMTATATSITASSTTATSRAVGSRQEGGGEQGGDNSSAADEGSSKQGGLQTGGTTSLDPRGANSMSTREVIVQTVKEQGETVIVGAIVGAGLTFVGMFVVFYIVLMRRRRKRFSTDYSMGSLGTDSSNLPPIMLMSSCASVQDKE